MEDVLGPQDEQEHVRNVALRVPFANREIADLMWSASNAGE